MTSSSTEIFVDLLLIIDMYIYEVCFSVYCYVIDTMDSVKDVLGKWGKKAAEATKKGQDLAGNMWQHCK